MEEFLILSSRLYFTVDATLQQILSYHDLATCHSLLETGNRIGLDK
jgi:hypothetical protein